ncbi:diacylglycerol/lipid kinase family protein [Emticicia fluvialis]|uniref:diacylglycerol/lipid kinase family protein n=1 Tax=Emticicia fluvialis TaxID=2974474 RepID=UPI0021667E43|nr:diacylglycerol kinase family protein [Emticicia fluvialis]
MNRQEIWFVVNPFSGRVKNHQKVVNLIESLLDKQRYKHRIIETRAAGHATDIAAEAAAKEVPYIVAMGGDGTVNETAKALVGSSSALGILPMGSGNGLARELRISMNAAKAIQQLNNASLRAIDTCYANEMPFFCTAGLGFDAQCAYVFAGMKGRGLMNYVKAGFSEFWSYKPVACHFGGNEYEVFSITFGNARQFGNNAYIAPIAQIDDGFIDCTLINPMPLWGVPGMVNSLFNQTIHESAFTESYRSTLFRLKGKDRLLIHFDGEPRQLGTDELTISIKQKSLLVMT